VASATRRNKLLEFFPSLPPSIVGLDACSCDPTAACARSLTSCPDSEERTGIRFEKGRVYGYSGGAKALPGRPLALAIAPIRGSRR